MIDAQRNALLCLHPYYNHRVDPVAFDDRPLRDEWQDEVYRYARRMAIEKDCRRIVDFGCGSGFKLMKYFSGFDTIGIEIEPALSHVRETYPDRVWRDGSVTQSLAGDMVIAADVIEHLPDPAAFLRSLALAPLQWIILSTPALEILAERGQSPRLGPPDNISHLNEWTTREFRDFVAMHLRVIEHLVVSATQGTQLIVVRRRGRN